MKCASGKEKKIDYTKMVKCIVCETKIAKDVAAIMYLQTKEYIFCSHNCQDLWEEKNPGLLW